MRPGGLQTAMVRDELRLSVAIMPAKAGIQYAAAIASDFLVLWNTGSPHSRG
jgi:hypothetical protein